MQTEIENQNKDRVLKTLAVGGFVGLIIIIAWLGIQLINVMPSAITSLASLADSVYNYEPVELDVTSSKTVANAGETFSLAWNIPKQAGDFTFSYECVDGIAVETRTMTGTLTAVACGQAQTLGNVSGVDISITSEKERFADVPYAISFVPTNTKEAPASKLSSITVVNASIGTTALAATTTKPVTEVVPTPTPKPEPTPVVVTPKPPVPIPVAAPVTVTVTVPKPVYVQTPIYTVPVSNPNGYTDLGITLIGAGTIDNSNRFTNVGTIDNDSKGAIQIQIKNTGTKTSNPFSFTVALPNGSTYASNEQTPLKPNERSVITLGFEVTNLIGIQSFKGMVTIVGNTNATNDTFAGAVTIVD